MSLSISNSESLSEEANAVSVEGCYAEAELRWSRRLMIICPLLACALMPVIHRFLLWVLYLQEPLGSVQWAAAFTSKPTLSIAGLLAAIPWIWRGILQVESRFLSCRWPVAMLLAAGFLIAASAAVQHPRAQWFFVEWVKVRTPNPSFARNTLFWEQRNFESTAPAGANVERSVGLVGSSQTYQGFDLKLLASKHPEWRFEKNALAGFGPMQYPFLLGRIAERDFDLIVCQLSEFDFYREDRVPVNRLRWAASPAGVKHLVATLDSGQLWHNRGELADLSFAAICPLWRLRDHFRRTVTGYWWKKSDPLPSGATDDRRLADAPDLQRAIVSLKQNIGRKELVEANFRSFGLFAKQLAASDVRLIVLEGAVHPSARNAYDTDGFQLETRRRLMSMAKDRSFTYVASDDMPAFTADDFADAYHLNIEGRRKLSAFLAERLSDKD